MGERRGAYEKLHVSCSEKAHVQFPNSLNLGLVCQWVIHGYV